MSKIYSFWTDVYPLDSDSKVKLNVISHEFNPKSVDFGQNPQFLPKFTFLNQNPQFFNQNLRFLTIIRGF